MKWNSTLTSGIYSYFLYCSNLEKNIDYDQISSVQLLTLVWLLGTPWLQHIRLPCPPTPGACLNSCPSIRWYDPTISSSAIPFSSGLQSFPASESFPMSWLFASGGQSTGHLSFSLSISPSNEYSGLISFRMDWFDLLAVQGTLRSLLQHHSSKASIFRCSAFFIAQLSHPYMTTGKTTALTRWTFVGKVIFYMLFRLVIAFLSRRIGKLKLTEVM